MVHYPVNTVVRTALDNFPAIKSKLSLCGKYESELEIVRLLGNTHNNWIEKLLIFIEKRLPHSGSIGTDLLRQTDPLQFRQRLRELFLLAYFTNRENLESSAAWSSYGRVHDIDLKSGSRLARLEVYCPMDYFGFQWVKEYSEMLFRYSACPSGFQVEVMFIPLEEEMSFFHAEKMIWPENILRKWLKSLKCKIDDWLGNSTKGSKCVFDGIEGSFELRATLEATYDDPEYRVVIFDEPTRSNDTLRCFELPSKEDTARSQIGQKTRGKLEKAQCGEPSPDYLRILVIDFSLCDTDPIDLLNRPNVIVRLDETVKLFASQVESSLPYDVVIPANLGFECCFGEPVILDEAREEEIVELARASGLDQRCHPMKPEQPPREWLEYLFRANPDQLTHGNHVLFGQRPAEGQGPSFGT